MLAHFLRIKMAPSYQKAREKSRGKLRFRKACPAGPPAAPPAQGAQYAPAGQIQSHGQPHCLQPPVEAEDEQGGDGRRTPHMHPRATPMGKATSRAPRRAPDITMDRPKNGSENATIRSTRAVRATTSPSGVNSPDTQRSHQEHERPGAQTHEKAHSSRQLSIGRSILPAPGPHRLAHQGGGGKGHAVGRQIAHPFHSGGDVVGRQGHGAHMGHMEVMRIWPRLMVPRSPI